jgi:hypothetical protein
MKLSFLPWLSMPWDWLLATPCRLMSNVRLLAYYYT